jgi:hypothetical protein
VKNLLVLGQHQRRTSLAHDGRAMEEDVLVVVVATDEAEPLD